VAASIRLWKVGENTLLRQGKHRSAKDSGIPAAICPSQGRHGALCPPMRILRNGGEIAPSREREVPPTMGPSGARWRVAAANAGGRLSKETGLAPRKGEPRGAEIEQQFASSHIPIICELRL